MSKNSTQSENFVMSNAALLNGAETMEDFEAPSRLSYLAEQFKLRSGRGRATEEDKVFSSQFVLQQAAQRYYSLVDRAVLSMAGLFSEQEVVALLNSTCGPVWRYQVGVSLAGNIADDRGIEDLDELEDGCELKVLLLKLANLTSLQTAALVDLCERYWRSPGNCSIDQTFRAMGLELVH